MSGFRRAVREAAERTPVGRERHADLLRAVAITAVVVGHWLAIVVTYDGAFGGDSAVGSLVWARPLTWVFQVMPVFFFVGGYANAASLTSYRAKGGTATGWLLGRTDRLIRPTTAFFTVIAVAAATAALAGVDPVTLNMAVWLAMIPLWFLVVYFAVVFLTPVMLALHHRMGLAIPAGLVALVALGDLARLGLDGPQAALGNFLFAWLAVHQLGIAWREGGLPERAGGPLAVAGFAALLLLTTVGPYPVSMVTVPGEEVQNTSPPTLALLALASTQIGLALLLRDRGNRWLRRIRPWTVVVGINSMIMTLFLWHMTAAVIAAVSLYPTGLFPQPPTGSAAWLLLRIPWLAVLGVILGVLVAAFGGIERRGGPRPAPEDPPSGPLRRAVAVAGSAAVVAGLLGVALTGPGGRALTDLPIEAFAGYAVGATLLRYARQHPGS